MASWICYICGFAHNDNYGFCMGCSHPGTSLEYFADCRTCGRENRPDEICGWCGTGPKPDPVELYDDDGNLIDEDGNRIDEDGNLLDEDGEIIDEDLEDE